MPQRIRAEPAIGIHNDNDVGRVETQVPYTELQRIAFAAARWIRANYHFDPCCLDNRSRVIGAIVHDHEDAVIGSELSLNIPDGAKYSHPLVVSRNEDSRSVGWPAGRRHSRGPFLAQNKAARQDLGKPDECQKRRQANDRNHDAEHSFHFLKMLLRNNNLYETADDFYLVTEKKQIFLVKINMLGYYNHSHIFRN
jgi:hypothetical protein